MKSVTYGDYDAQSCSAKAGTGAGRFDMFTENIGFTPNMMATFAQSPIAFNSWAALLGSLSKALDVKTRDSIGLAVSEVNGCNYCLTVHSFTAEHMAASLRFIHRDQLESGGYGEYLKLFTQEAAQALLQ